MSEFIDRLFNLELFWNVVKIVPAMLLILYAGGKFLEETIRDSRKDKKDA